MDNGSSAAAAEMMDRVIEDGINSRNGQTIAYHYVRWVNWGYSVVLLTLVG